MLAGGGAARRSGLPAVCLHFSLFNVGSLVCEAQLHGLIVNQSIPCEHACPYACWLVIFYPNCPWVVRECVNAPTAGHMQAISLCDRWRNAGGGVTVETFAFLKLSITTKSPAYDEGDDADSLWGVHN